MYLKNVIKHLGVITRHKWVVFKLCLKVGEPWRGLMHDLSKYSPTEFFESVKYYTGTHSPIVECKKDKGYSNAWLHHRGRNKHHIDYWIDLSSPDQMPIMPYKYVVEMICDKLAAGIIYMGKEWTKEYELQYWLNERDKTLVNDQIEKLITECLTQVSEVGIDEALTKKNLKELYNKYCVNYNKKETNSNFSEVQSIK